MYCSRVAVVAGLANPLATHIVLTHPSLTATTLQTLLAVISGASHALVYGGLGAMFGLSLRPGEEALVSRLARRVEPIPTTAVMSYTRGVTWLWTIFCIAQLLVSACLLTMAPLTVWSAFVNVANVPLVITTFLAEYAVRRWRFRRLPMASLADTIRAFARRSADNPVASPK